MYEYVIGFTVFCVCTVMGDEILQETFQASQYNPVNNPVPPSPGFGNNVSVLDSYRKFDIPQDQKPVTCVNSQLLISILNNLLKILSDGKESLPPNVIEQINNELDLMQKYLNDMPNSSLNAEILEKFKHLQEKYNNISDTLVKPQTGNIKTKVVLKYEIPSLDQHKCRQALIKLMEIANTAYRNILNQPICQGSGIGVQNIQHVNDNDAQNEVQYSGLQSQIPINTQGLITSNQQFTPNIYGLVGDDSNLRPLNLNSVSNMNLQNHQLSNSAFSNNNVMFQSSNTEPKSFNNHLSIQPLEPLHPFVQPIQTTSNIQYAVGPNPGYSFSKMFKEQLDPRIIYSSRVLQTPIVTNLPYLNPNNYFNQIIQIPNTYPTPYNSADAGSSYKSFSDSLTTVKPTRPSFVDREKANFNSIIYNTNEDEFSNNLQHAKYVAESMAQAIKALHERNSPTNNINTISNLQQNPNSMLLNNANQLTLPGQFPTTEELLTLTPLVNYQNKYPKHSELLNVHYQKIPVRQADSEEDPGSSYSEYEKVVPGLTSYFKNHKRNNPVEQKDGLEDNGAQNSPQLNGGLGQPSSPVSFTGPFDGNDQFKLQTSLPSSDSDPHRLNNPIIQNTATFNINNDVLNLTSSSTQIQDPHSNRITNRFQKDIFSNYPSSQANFEYYPPANLNEIFGNNLNQYQNPNLNPIKGPNSNYFENMFPKLHEQLKHLNLLQNQLSQSKQYQNQNRFPNRPNNQVQFQNMNNMQMSPSKFKPDQMPGKPMPNENCGSYQFPCEDTSNSNQYENQFIDPNPIQDQPFWDEQNSKNPPNNYYNPKPPRRPQPPFQPYAHNANNYFNIASQNGQFHNVQQFNPSLPQSNQYPGRNEHPQSPDQEKQNETTGNQRLFDSTTNNVQTNNNFIIQPPVTLKPPSIDLQSLVTSIPKSIDQQLNIKDQRTSFIDPLPGFNKIPSYHNNGGTNVKPNLEQWVGVTNLYKLNYEPNKRGLIELTYLLQRPNPMLYQPFYIVKYTVPYITYLRHLRESLQNRPYLRSDPAQLYNELIPKSNITEVSPDLRNYDEDSIKDWVLRNGSLYKAKIVNKNLTSVDDHVKMVRDMTSDMPQGEFDKILDDMIKDNNKSEINDPNSHSSDLSVKPIEDAFNVPGMQKSNHDTYQKVNPRRFMVPPNYKQDENSSQEAPKYVEDAPYNHPVPQKNVVPQNYAPVQNYPVPNYYQPTQNYPRHQTYPSIQNDPHFRKNPPHQSYPPLHSYPILQNYPSHQNYPPLSNLAAYNT